MFPEDGRPRLASPRQTLQAESFPTEAIHDAADRVDESITALSRLKRRLSGNDGFVFYPDRPLNGLKWFKRLREINPNFSLGLQVVNDAAVLEGLKQEYSHAKALQEGCA